MVKPGDLIVRIWIGYNFEKYREYCLILSHVDYVNEGKLRICKVFILNESKVDHIDLNGKSRQMTWEKLD